MALNQILEKHADDAVSRQRFIAEAEITGGLEHPGSSPSTAWAPISPAPLLRDAAHQGRLAQGGRRFDRFQKDKG